MAAGAGRKGGKKNRKYGRKNRRPSYARYKNEQRWIENKAKRIAKQMKKFSNYKPFNVSEEVMSIVNKILS